MWSPATAGVARGPLPYKLLNAARGYCEAHSFLPVLASNADNSSLSMPATLAWTKTFPPATTGELLPSPTGCRQRTLGAAVQGATFSEEELSRFGPNHCGQSSARHGMQTTRIPKGKTQRIVFSYSFRALPLTLRV